MYCLLCKRKKQLAVIYLLCLTLYFFQSWQAYVTTLLLKHCVRNMIYTAPVSLLHGSEGRSDNAVLSDSERRACKYKLEIT